MIPKTMREQAGLQPGTELEVTIDNGRVVLIAPRAQGRIVYERGLPVWESAPGTSPVSQDEINRWIRILREEREKF